MSQLTKIEAILRAEGQIDNFYCVNNRLTWRLGARIDDLKKRGWEFAGGYYDDRNPKNYVYKVIHCPAEVVKLEGEKVSQRSSQSSGQTLPAETQRTVAEKYSIGTTNSSNPPFRSQEHQQPLALRY